MKTKRFRKISPYLLVLLSFLLIILLGSFLLTLPYAHKNGEWGSYIDALFNATSGTCVTGLSTYSLGIGGELTLFGQIVMLVLIEIGGLGLVTFVTFIITLFTKVQFKDRLFLSQAVNSSSVAHVAKFVRKIILVSLTIQLIGFLIGLPVFFNLKSHLPGTTNGDVIWYSLFTAGSMYNNAGFDVFGPSSFIRGMGNVFIDNLDSWAYYLLCSYIMILIVLGGISYLVIFDVFSPRRPRQWRVFTKIVLSTTAILIVGGMGLLLLTDGIKTDNRMDPFQALFQSVTCRTAGAATYDQSKLSVAGKVVSCFLMFVGGSPISTAGGIKTTTLFIIVISVVCYFRGKKAQAFKRIYSQTAIVKAMSLVLVALTLLIISFIVVVNLERSNNPLATNDNIVFELFSAFGTVGLTASLTPTLSIGSKIVLIILMFVGRLGPMTFFQIFNKDMDTDNKLHYEFIEEDFIIG